MSSHFNLTLVLPALLWPHPHTPVPELSLPGFNALRSQGKYTAQAYSRSSLYQQFLWHGSWLQKARQQLNLNPAAHVLLATPLSQNSGMHQVQCGYGQALALTLTEAQAFCQALSQWFHEDGWQFMPLSADVWLVQTPRPLDFSQPDILDLGGVISIADKPQGADARLLLQKQTELQMFLYQHPLNQQRTVRGLPAINDVWLQQDSIGQQSPKATVYSNSSRALGARPVLNGWYELLQHHAETEVELIVCLTDLCDLADQGDVFGYADRLHQWESLWWQPLWHSFQTRQQQKLTMVCDGDHGGILSITPSVFSWLRRPKAAFNGHTL
ncbi:hypothetical protein PT286_01070 [Neisseriaceae bacterium ESL0693]|nr:hypothetical protein [Neisseriaceae bacterium ESL0693]